MAPLVFIVGLGGLLFGSLAAGFFLLPKEGWQMVAALPVKKCGAGQWQGLNLTWYGLLSANAYTFGAAMAILLAASAGLSFTGLLVFLVLMLALTIPASKIVARIVEKKKATLTVGGAVFVGVVAAPWLVVGVNLTLGELLGYHLPVLVVMACLSIAYAFGEGMGRLACLSFGCCYGKPLCRCAPVTQKIFSHFHVVYTGETKKVAYADGMAGEKMIPIQMITGGLYVLAGLGGLWLFFNQMVGLSLIFTLMVTQIWRVASEFFRADFRGNLKFSAYQYMALGAVAYTGVVVLVFSMPRMEISLDQGLGALWHPGVILFCQALWLVSFLHSGRSSVTGSRISFHVVQDRI